VRWRHSATADRPAVDVFWYDGGMKPPTPEEVYEDGDELASEGMLLVGDTGSHRPVRRFNERGRREATSNRCAPGTK
jgi:hypothetical protein